RIVRLRFETDVDALGEIFETSVHLLRRRYERVLRIRFLNNGDVEIVVAGNLARAEEVGNRPALRYLLDGGGTALTFDRRECAVQTGIVNVDLERLDGGQRASLFL